MAWHARKPDSSSSRGVHLLTYVAALGHVKGEFYLSDIWILFCASQRTFYVHDKDRLFIDISGNCRCLLLES